MKQRIILSAVILLCLFAAASCIRQADTDNLNSYTSDKSLPALTAVGTNLTDPYGNVVRLSGVNLGGWLVFEEWFCPVYDNKDSEPKASGSDIYNILLSRFSENDVNTLIDTYQDNWITEYDLDYLQSIGVNCVRVPFWYRNFQHNDGSWKYDNDRKIDFGRLDWIIEQCGKRSIYVILDLHGAPGFQNAAHHSGANNNCRLFDNTPEGKAYREQTVYLWKELAERYNGCTTVAGFDLLNEPYCDMPLDSSAYQNINNMYDLLYNAVREVNTSTVLIMEGMWRLNNLPSPTTMGWENVMYEAHFYGHTTKPSVDETIKHLSDYSELYNIPVYVGEFESGECEEYAIINYSDIGASYTTWTYKGLGADKQWFLRYSPSCDRANIVTDSYDEILKKWGLQLQTKYTNKGLFGIKTAKTFKTNEIIEQAIISSLN